MPLAIQACRMAGLRMAIAGPVPSARDRKEFHRMGAEKTAAFTSSWNAMVVQTMRANQALAATMMKTMLSPSATAAMAAAASMQGAALGILGKGLAPVHRTATANAKRLGRTKLR